MDPTVQNSMSGSQANTASIPKWSQQVQLAFDLYRELESMREKVADPDTVQAIDECLGHLLVTLNTIIAELGNAPLFSEQPAFKFFMRQIARRLQAENRTVRFLIRKVATTKLNPILRLDVATIKPSDP